MKLWVLTGEHEDHPVGHGAPVYREATVGELVEVLKQEGAVERRSFPLPSKSHAIGVTELGEGLYLVLPLGDTP